MFVTLPLSYSSGFQRTNETFPAPWIRVKETCSGGSGVLVVCS